MGQNQTQKNDVIPILIKGWETMQSLAKGSGDSAWNLRAWGISVWSALVAYAYTSNKAELIIVAIVMLFAVLLIEMAIRQIQYQFIEKSIVLEKSINDALVGEEPRIPEGGISTNIETPTISDFLKLLAPKRWLIWFPYFLLTVFSLAALQNF